MKRIHSFLLVLAFSILLCAGCGLNESSVTDYPAALMVDGEIYLLSVAPIAGEVDESAIIGYTESYTNEYPEENGQTNFSRELGMPYARVDGGIAVLYQNEWYLCIPENEKLKDTVIQTYAAEAKEGRLKTYYEMANGTWKTEEYSYLYKIELTGRLHNAAKDTTFVCLSNSENVSFSKIADSIFSSDMADFLDREEVVIVEMLIVENVSPTVTPVPNEVLEKEDLITMLKTNYDGQIPSSASAPYVLQADESNCMVVFGQGATTLIYVTGDGGATWEQTEIPEAGKHQHAIVTCAAAISDTAYCVGYRYWGVYDGAFYLTTDCGKTWEKLVPEEALPEEITANMRYAEAVAVNHAGDKLQLQVSCKTTVLPPWSIEVILESADLGKTWSVVETWEKETDEE